MSIGKLMGIAGTALRSNLTALDRPYKLNFSITYWCQSRCLSCNIWQIKPKGELSIEEIRDFARKNDYFKWIEITGGEPFLRPDLVDIVKAFSESSKGLYILTMPTNSLCDHAMVERKLREILSLGIPKVAITVSLDGYRELHDRLRGVPGNYDKAIDMFRRLMALRREFKNLYMVFGYTLSKLNTGEFQRTFESVKRDIPEITYNDFHINLAQLSDNYYNNSSSDIAPDKSRVADELSEFVSHMRYQPGVISAIESTFMKNLVVYARTGKSPMRSRSLDASLFMDSYGNVYPSIMWNRKIGNIRDTGYDLMAMWRNDEANGVRRDIMEGKDPIQWTSCEAYQSITGNVLSMFR